MCIEDELNRGYWSILLIMASSLTSKPRRVRIEGPNPELNLRRNIMIQGMAEKLAAQRKDKQEVNQIFALIRRQL